jgi:hypothetical protein
MCQRTAETPFIRETLRENRQDTDVIRTCLFAVDFASPGKHSSKP